MASPFTEFSSWLSAILTALNTDEGIFGSYITKILDNDDPKEEKLEALQGILSEIIEQEELINKSCNEILDRWTVYKNMDNLSLVVQSSADVDSKLVKLLESQTLATTTQKKYSDEEKKIREAILMQYSQMTDEEDEEETPKKANGVSDNNLEKNTNALFIIQAEKVKREQAKIESHKKKEKDKEDREKQKQMKEDKKEKRKTQKGERKR